MTELKAITVYFNERQVQELKEYKDFLTEQGEVISTSNIVREVILDWMRKEKRYKRWMKAKEQQCICSACQDKVAA